ncbi:hypothetical protein KY290_033515 [Solanum tuberosum]|uniref:Integrase core domain containing protein n=1 Tax=Solanum tuberosum TaxID=4113 RepID=A0ABQ7U0I7_SOLTU|nr:hypothetical protein KY289_032870 [Solanum tuberosum]KAH0647517.1 hypothetical protein KY285_032765 [Solanum tuberosum]KAH0740472.1 hypothetical protein KY290_033515 [Solanum tuberosum]
MESFGVLYAMLHLGDIDDTPLSQLCRTGPRRPHNHVAAKKTSICIPFTWSVSQTQYNEVVESSKKCHRIGKSLVLPPPSTIVLDSDPDECVHSESSLPNNLAKYLAMGKERYFGSKAILSGRTFHPEVRMLDVVKKVLDLLYFQGWVDLFLYTRLMVYEKEVVEFYANLNGRVTTKPMKVLKGKMALFHKLMYELVHKGVLPRGERRHKKFLKDIEIANALENKDPIDWPILMIKHMARGVDPKPGPHQLAFGNLLTTILLDENDQVHAAPPRATGPVTSLLKDLHAARAQNDVLRAEIET